MNAGREFVIPARCGFTLAELLVCLLVLALLAALIVPAVQEARSSARRTECEDRLHQIGLAIHAFEGRNRETPDGFQFWSALLDDLTEANLRRKLEAFEPVNAHMPVLQCPADDWSDEGSAFVSYELNAGTRFRDCTPSNGFRRNEGGGGRRFSEVTDGLSQTAMAAERLIDRLASGDVLMDVALIMRRPQRFLWFTSAPIRGAGDEEEFVATCRTKRIMPVPYVRPWTSRLPHTAAGYDHLLTPNGVGCLNGNASGYDDQTATAPSTSLHPGGVNVLMCDGRVAFVSESISGRVWRSVGTINGGEVAGF